jgi:hypothetical protein
MGSPKFMKLYDSIPKASDLYREIDNALTLLKENYMRGQRIEREKWPQCYVQAFDVNNLRRFELREGRRLIYTIYTKSDTIQCNVLEVFDNHKEYDKRFGY